jgi:hypothetical protein
MLLIYSVRCLFLRTLLIGEKTWEDGNVKGIANRGHHKMGWAHSQNEKPEVSLSPLHQIPKFVLMELTENDRSSQHVAWPHFIQVGLFFFFFFFSNLHVNTNLNNWNHQVSLGTEQFILPIALYLRHITLSLIVHCWSPLF